MPTNRTANNVSPWNDFYGPNLGYVQELYEQYRKDPNSVDPGLKELFEEWGTPPMNVADGPTQQISIADQSDMIEKAVEAGRLVRNIRTFGHLAADIDPIEGRPDANGLFDLEKYGLTEQDLRTIPARLVWKEAHDDVEHALDAINRLREIYTQSLGYDFDHVHNVKERMWLIRKIESEEMQRTLSSEERISLLNRLTEVEVFEHFLQRTFVGQKRFSIEGVDALVPMLDETIRFSVQNGTHDVMIGMAHRGRLNVLAHVLGKPYELIFAEFHRAPNKELVPSEGSIGINYGWTGDVKYHLGADRAFVDGDVIKTRIRLANNPSHLEFVNPVVEGFTRAAQEDRTSAGFPKQDVTKALAILVHGDSAFPGEGVVAETLNLSRLKGFNTGGTIHIIANNRIGFTTESADSRSTLYASDLAKGFEIPIVHVNADDVEACLFAVRLACEYRARFNKDFLIDLIGYRRLGHNETDDPVVTQPKMYEKINNHPTVRSIYAKALESDNVISPEQAKEMEQSILSRLRKAYEKMQKEHLEPKIPRMKLNTNIDIDTSVPADRLKEINRDLLRFPEGFTVYPKLERILRRREHAFDEDGKVDWALAETMAFATILADGRPIRLTGQDTERGTFAHRHLVLHDVKTGKTHLPLHAIPQAKASFAIHNSPLSEVSVLGFEYGYDVFAPETLVLWEAQFGDFANAAQVIIDQFISSGRAKWGENSGLVLLLPHGYEGQGPEHSSARLERFLQLAAEHNWWVVNLTSAAQYFHILRLQAAKIEEKTWHPLVIMTPKSLLRNPLVASPASLFSEGRYLPILEQEGLDNKKDGVERLILCSGKVAVDLEEKMQSDEKAAEWVRIVRVEQLYPFPKDELERAIHRYDHSKEIVWLQEEPKNMGSWTYMEPKLKEIAPNGVAVKYIGRRERSSPAEGMSSLHQSEQSRILTEALTRTNQ